MALVLVNGANPRNFNLDLRYVDRWVPANQYSLSGRKMTWSEYIFRTVKLIRSGQIKVHAKHKRTNDQILNENDGWTLPYYNYCGPTSMLDSICMMHDLNYALKTTSERYDDNIFVTRLRNWLSSNAGELDRTHR